MHRKVPTKEKRLHFHLAHGHLAPLLWVVQCSIVRVMVQLSKKSKKMKTRATSKTLLRFQSRVWRDLPFLMDVETTDVGFTFAGGETEAASTKICVPHGEFSQGTSGECRVKRVSEYGLVTDFHHNRVYSHILKRYFPCAILSTGHLTVEMMPSKQRMGTAPSVESSPLDSALGPTFKGTGERNAFM